MSWLSRSTRKLPQNELQDEIEKNKEALEDSVKISLTRAKEAKTLLDIATEALKNLETIHK